MYPTGGDCCICCLGLSCCASVQVANEIDDRERGVVLAQPVVVMAQPIYQPAMQMGYQPQIQTVFHSGVQPEYQPQVQPQLQAQGYPQTAPPPYTGKF